MDWCLKYSLIFKIRKSKTFAKHSQKAFVRSAFFQSESYFSIKGLYIMIALFSLINSSVVSPVDLS